MDEVGKETRLNLLLGRAIKLKTMSNEQVEGTVYTCDKVTNCLVLDCSTQDKHNSFRILKIAHIKEVVSVEEERKAYASIGYIHLDALKSREATVLKGFRDQASKVGVGVTKDGQDIFNALSKTLPCHWSKESIVVMDEIVILPPYGIDHCKSKTETPSTSLARVKKVLEGERKRLGK
ncbi:anticodon-binding domain-containing protein [Sporodiniella umbellata]|nr:anticodon-binding domain-containing protein [Sporodiniella umbellata]